ncbi:MAG TPA: hypothetical protein VKI40_10730 [Terriglobales bacterium]|nr:hypothetical protein [Terriglobales bacterium]
MKSRVFISCGQRASEKEIAVKLGDLLVSRGFDVYVAISVQTILEINARIIRELKNSDCFLFVNFRREKINGKYRGSLFSNQELAIAYSLGFERILVINQDGILPEGILAYIGVNTETFTDSDNCYAVVEKALDRAGWTPQYSRRLRADRLRWSADIIRYGNLQGRFLYLDILNNRPDIAALETTARLSEIGKTGEALKSSPIRSPLKATGRPGFSHTIFPKSYEAFDLFCVGAYSDPNQLVLYSPPLSGAPDIGRPVKVNGPGVFLNSAYDVLAAPRLPITLGTWQLRYDFFAIDFPVLSVLIELSLVDWEQPKATILTQDQT